MKTVWTVIGAVVVVAAIAFAIFFVDVDQTQEAALPEVTVEGGQLPEFDATVGEINVGTETVEVEVPTISVESPEEAGKEAAGEPVLGDAAEDAAAATENAADATADAVEEAGDAVTENN